MIHGTRMLPSTINILWLLGFAIYATSGTSAQASEDECVPVVRDIFFVVDGSASVKTHNFVKVRNFLKKFASSTRISPDVHHIGLLQFSEKTVVELPLKGYTQEEVLNAFTTMEYQVGLSTNTGTALKTVVDQVFIKTGGDRPDIADLLIVFTDGTSHQPREMEENAKILRDKGVRIIAIGAGENIEDITIEKELLKIATNKSDVILSSFDNLNNIVRDIIPRSDCWTTTTTTTPTPLPAGCLQNDDDKDILFVVDGSYSSPGRFEEIREFLKGVMGGLDPEKIRVGVLLFNGNRDPTTVINLLDENMNTQRMLSKLDAMRVDLGRGRMIGAALAVASNKFYEFNALYDRYDATDFVVILTTAQASDQEKMNSEMEILKMRNIRILAISYGLYPGRLVNYFSNMVSSPKDDIYIANTLELRSIRYNFLEKLCTVRAAPAVRPPPIIACEQRKYDIFFVLDGSASINLRNFQRQKRLVQMILSLIKSQNPDSHVGLMQFSERNKTKVALKIGKHDSKTVLRQVEKMRYQYGRKTMLGDALSIVNSEVFTKKGGDRPDVEDVVFLLTDGAAHDIDYAFGETNTMKKNQVLVVTVMVKPSDAEINLKKMATAEQLSMKIRLSSISKSVEHIFKNFCKFDHTQL